MEKIILAVMLMTSISAMAEAPKANRKIANESDVEMIKMFDDYLMTVQQAYNEKSLSEQAKLSPVLDKTRNIWMSLRADYMQGRAISDFGCQNEAEKARDTTIYINKISVLKLANPSMPEAEMKKLVSLQSEAYKLREKQFSGITTCISKQIVQEAPKERFNYDSLKNELESLKK